MTLDFAPMQPAPPSNPETEAYWVGTEQGRLMLKTCLSCNKSHHYPRAHCPFCHGVETEWKQSGGVGEIYSYTVLRRESPPRVIAYVRLDEGVMMLTNIIECTPEDVRIGLRVKATFPTSPGDNARKIPAFVMNQKEA
ncbi:Zn-ribbon domain-containing OB-fold protein [Bradyrhizobium sp. DASA03007]|uniref:Zn-ribbon domain-containing OB-fold protein n=1 Tax=unclassified Bradyrhizobium TaxID=2631580 RepID=UPI003F6F49FF